MDFTQAEELAAAVSLNEWSCRELALALNERDDLRREVARLRAALERITEAIDVYTISGEEGCKPSLRWISHVCTEALDSTE